MNLDQKLITDLRAIGFIVRPHPIGALFDLYDESGARSAVGVSEDNLRLTVADAAKAAAA